MSLPAQNPSAHQKKVVIANKHGEKLVGILHESGTEDIVILCHGFRSSKEFEAIANLAAALENAGISSFHFDFAGNGESEGSFQYGNYWKEVEDLHAVAQHFCGEKRAVRAIVGHSKGGGVVLLYASKYHDIKTVVNLSGRYDLKSGVEDHLGKDFMERIKKDGCIDVHKSAFQQQKVIIPNKQGNKLAGILHDAGTLEIVILCHGLGASKWREVDDLPAVIQHFHGANCRVIAIIGHSKGANVVLLYASKHHDVKTVFNLSGRYNLAAEGIEERLGNDFMERIRKKGFIEVNINSGRYRVTEESLKDRLSINMHEECLKIDKERRVFTVHGSADQAIPVSDLYELARILPSHKLHIIEGATHIYADQQADLTSVVVNFIKETAALGH